MHIEKTVLTLAEAAAYTGFDKEYLKKLLHSGLLPYSKPNGRFIFIELEKLNKWLMSNEIKPAL